MAKHPSLAELLAPFRAEEPKRRSGLVLVVDDPEVRRLLAAWESIPVPPWSRPGKRQPADARERWFWIWDGSGGLYQPPYMLELAYAAQVGQSIAIQKWRAAVANRVAYPDGSITDEARRLIERYVDRQLEPRGRAAKADAAPPPAPSAPAADTESPPLDAATEE